MASHTIQDCKIIAATGKAVLVESDELDEPTWVPQSQIDEDSEIWEKGQEGDLLVSEWFAKQRGLI